MDAGRVTLLALKEMRVRSADLKPLVGKEHRKLSTGCALSRKLLHAARNRKVCCVIQLHMGRRKRGATQHCSYTTPILDSDREDEGSILKVADPDGEQPLVIRPERSQKISDSDGELRSCD